MAKNRPAGPPPATAIFIQTPTIRKGRGIASPALRPSSWRRPLAGQVLVQVEVVVEVLDHPDLPAWPERGGALAPVVALTGAGHPVRPVRRPEVARDLATLLGGRVD